MEFSETTWVILARVLLAGGLGAMIGFERDVHGRSAGLRTHLLVAMGAAVFMVLSQLVAAEGVSHEGKIIASDPGRIAAQIVTGIGFLGAGVIIKEGITVRGLTTSACLWIAAGIGMSAGAGYFTLAIVTTVSSLLGLVGLKSFEKTYKKDSYRILTIKTPVGIDSSSVIRVVKEQNLDVMSCDIYKNYEEKTTVTRLTLRIFHNKLTDKLAHGIIAGLEDSHIELKSVDWTRS